MVFIPNGTFVSQVESGDYSILAINSAPKIIRKAIGDNFVTSSEFQVSAVLNGPNFINIAIVFDSDFGVVATNDATTPYPVICYFNHNTMNTSEIKYYRFMT